MKARFVPFIIFSFISLMAGYVTGNNIFYIFFTATICIAVLSVITLVINYSQFNYLQSVTPKTGVKGETVTLDMNIYNDFIVPLPMIELIYDLPDESLNMYSSSSVFAVPARSKVSISREVYCKYMGKWKVGISKVKIYDMFGLMHLTMDFYKNANYRTQSLIVKPRIVNLDYLPMPFKENISAQNQTHKNTADTAEVSDIRKYIQGDILKKIHWKLSAAKSELMVKNHSLSLDPDTLVYVDCSSHGFDGIKAIELEDMIAECATAVAHHILQGYLSAKFVMMGKERFEITGRRPDDFFSVYEYISEISFDYDFSFFELFADELSAISHVNSIFIITHSIDAKGFDSLMYLREAGINITVMLIEQAEKSHEERFTNIVTELKSVGVTIISIFPGGDLNIAIKEQTDEKKAV